MLIGFVNGFFGGGGGMLCVPLLMFSFKLKDKSAHATALLVMLPISVVSFLVYLSNFEPQFDTTILVLFGSLVGGVLGSFLLKRMSNECIRFLFSIIMIVAGFKIIF